MSDWLTAQDVLTRLRLKPQTLYAYVSRGLIEARSDVSDARKSLYRAADVGALEHRKARARRRADPTDELIAWSDPELASAITTIARDRLWYRGEDAVLLSEKACLEDAARLLWACGNDRFPPQTWAIPQGKPEELMFAALGYRASRDSAMRGRSANDLYFEAASILDMLADVVSGHAGKGAIHERLARAWGCRVRGADLIRRALVLLADDELTAPTLAVRITASTGTSLAASVLSGLATLSGSDQRRSAARIDELAKEARRVGAAVVVGNLLAAGEPIPGFGHPLYPNGDPRAKALLDHMTLTRDYTILRDAVGDITGLQPSMDFALAVLADRLNLPAGAPFQIFAIARAAGWIAHALEQHQSARAIRPRVRYIGPEPKA